jgi:hypothetical protein
MLSLFVFAVILLSCAGFEEPFVSFEFSLFMAMLIPLLISFLISLLSPSFLQILSCGCLCLARGFSCYHIGIFCCG